MPQQQRLVFPQLASFRIRGAFWAVVPKSVLKIYTINGRMYEFRTSDGLQWETVDGVTTMSGWTLDMVQTFAEKTGNSIPAANVADCSLLGQYPEPAEWCLPPPYNGAMRQFARRRLFFDE